MNELSIIIPCISSAETLIPFVDQLSVHLMSNPSDVDIIIVVNEGIPAIGKVVHHIHKNYPWLKFEILQRKGHARSFGALIRFGMAYSSSRYVVLVSPYGEDDISLITPMLNAVRKGAQVVQVNRYSSQIDSQRIPINFRAYQSVYRFLIKLLLGFKISDSTYAFKMFDRVFIQSLGLNQNGFSLCPEITLKALLADGKVEYIASKTKSSINKDFKLYREGPGYFYLLVRGLGHRLGILWF